VKLDCVKVLETGYAPAAVEEDWLRGLVASLEPLADGLGVLVSSFEYGGSGRGLRSSVASAGVPGPVARAYRELFQLASVAAPVLRHTMFDPPPCVCRSSHRLAMLEDGLRGQVRTIFAGTGIRECLGVAAVEPDGSGLLVSIPCDHEASLPPRTVHQLTRVAAHLCSALRLRAPAGERTAGRDPAQAAGVEAVLTPSGRVRHATGEAASREGRTNLAEAVRRVERARGRLRRSDPDEALAIWSALFDGRWSIVECTESDGRRSLLARRNQPGGHDLKALAPAERHVLAYAAMGHSNKYIGYALGVATSTVSSRLASAIRKLGVRSRRDVIELFGPLAGPPPAA
jgi:DNA-binding CsgD family transcriptional regulator